MTRVLITGASGFVGANVLSYMLEKTNWEFTALCSWRHRGNPLRLTPNERVTVISHDLTGPIPELGEFDYILHLASESHVDRSIAEPVDFIENNVSSTLQVLEYARTHEPQVFLLFSTDEVWGTQNHSEDDVLMPSNPYAASKACQEMIALAYWRTYGVPVVITNSNNIVGPGQDAEKFIPKIAGLLERGERITIHTVNGRPGVRYYNPVENVADALLFILGCEPTWYPSYDKPDRYSLPGGESKDNLEMAQLVSEILGVELDYELVDAESVRPGYDQFYPEAGSKLIDMGWKPPLTLEEGLAWLSQ